MRAREYPLLCEAVEVGVKYGWNRAHKHVDNPSEYTILEDIQEAVLNEICERFVLDAYECTCDLCYDIVQDDEGEEW